MSVCPYDRLTVCPSLLDIVRGPRALAFNRAYRGHPAAVHTEALGRRELTIITFIITLIINMFSSSITITNDTLNIEVSKIGSEGKAHLT